MALAPDWAPFEDRPSFEFAELMFETSQLSQGDINQLLKIWAAKAILHGHDGEFFPDNDAVKAAIDEITVEYTVHTRNIRVVLHNMAASPDFDGKWETCPYQEFRNGERRFANLMSDNWAYRQANIVAEDPDTHGSMLVPVILGADKTTVSVATGNTEFHPLYVSAGNVTNELRRAHRDAVLLVTFLAIPKAPREEENTAEFRLFKKQVYHASIARILCPIERYMTKPNIVYLSNRNCSDRYYQHAIYEIGPFIADYPEQVLLAGIVQDWCPKCLGHPDDLDNMGSLRFREQTEHLKATYDAETLWDVFGVASGVTPFTHRFPRADIHELLTPDLLHQVIKRTFKDHLVTWVQEYVEQNNGRKAKQIMDDIDHQYVLHDVLAQHI
ncbi:hypothetical protein FA95DRAFT_1583919 [Auriscalpium vulgare]|uniref:Uncharacterized protein n=1 Tax=Auriscalpium vulgare TaxID=40419 RepID=A0ACB8RIM6_9AGAM|nr:hypothetical protein FA95DRAFT_1583919 [Auriscalpium vulgare]